MADAPTGEQRTTLLQRLRDCRRPWGYNEEGKFVFSRNTLAEWGLILLAITAFYALLIAIFVGMYFAGLAVRGKYDTLDIPGTVFPCSPANAPNNPGCTA